MNTTPEPMSTTPQPQSRTFHSRLALFGSMLKYFGAGFLARLQGPQWSGRVCIELTFLGRGGSAQSLRFQSV